MTCPEHDLVAFLAGELSEEEERRVDEHLLSCEACWQAIQSDRAGRRALERLRAPAPEGLEGRVSLAVALEARTCRRAGAVPLPLRVLAAPRRVVVAVVAALLIAGGTAGALAARLGTSAPADPPQVAAVVAMMARDAAPSPALAAGEHRMIADQPLEIRAYRLHGKEALVATSSRPFPMPAASHLLSGSSPRAWMATRGGLSMYGVNRPIGQRSMFVVAAMPMAELPEVAAVLHLI